MVNAFTSSLAIGAAAAGVALASADGGAASFLEQAVSAAVVASAISRVEVFVTRRDMRYSRIGRGETDSLAPRPARARQQWNQHMPDASSLCYEAECQASLMARQTPVCPLPWFFTS